MKWFAILGCILFVGAAVAPSINAIKPENVSTESKIFSLGDNENFNCFTIGKTKITFFGGYLTPPLGRRVGLGVYNPLWDETYYAQGWINTIGLNGVKKWEGTLKGNLSISHRLILHHPSISTGLYEIYEGINGFKGLKIGRSNTFFIGFARQVKIDEIVIL